MDQDQDVQQSTEKSKLTKAERSKIMSDAAKRRWAKARKAKAKKAAPAPKKAALKVVKQVQPVRSEFSIALTVAEEELAKAMQTRARASAEYAAANAAIPSLMQIIQALKNPMQPQYGFGGSIASSVVPAPSLEQIVGDQPIPYRNPPRPVPAPVPEIPPQLHPANTMGRAGGGAIGVEIQDGEPEDEDRFLTESSVAGGQWR